MSLSFYPNNEEYLILKDDQTFEYICLNTGRRVSNRVYLETKKYIILGMISPDTFLKKDGNTLISRRGKTYYPGYCDQKFEDVVSSQDENLSKIWDSIDIEKYDADQDKIFECLISKMESGN